MLKARRSYSVQSLEVRGDVVAIATREALIEALAAIEDEDVYFVEQVFPQQGAAEGLGVSVAARNGSILAAFQHKRLTEKPGGGSSSVRISEELDEKMLTAVTRLTEAVKLNGVAMYEFRRSADTGKWVLLEVNARPWGSMPLPLALGVDFPAMLLDVHLPSGRGSFKREYRTGVVGRNLMLSMIHYIEDDSRPNRFLPFFAIGETVQHLVRCMRGVEVSDSFVWDDLKPAFLEYFALGGRFLRRNKWFKQGKPERRVLPSQRDDQQYVGAGNERELDSQFDQRNSNDRKVS
nr:ATP-grasp domain-containing protein [Maritalea mediterranea]